MESDSRIAKIAKKVVSDMVKLPFSGAESNYASPLRKRYDYGVIENLIKSCEEIFNAKSPVQK